jgi:hypothetical protein
MNAQRRHRQRAPPPIAAGQSDGGRCLQVEDARAGPAAAVSRVRLPLSNVDTATT